MFLRFEENPNSGFVDDRVLKECSEPRFVTHILRTRRGTEQWCPVTAMNDEKKFSQAMARQVEDSGEGICYLVYGGPWGLRLKEASCQDDWSLDDAHQWGEGFLLLPANGEDIRFAEPAGA